MSIGTRPSPRRPQAWLAALALVLCGSPILAGPGARAQDEPTAPAVASAPAEDPNAFEYGHDAEGLKIFAAPEDREAAIRVADQVADLMSASTDGVAGPVFMVRVEAARAAYEEHLQRARTPFLPPRDGFLRRMGNGALILGAGAAGAAGGALFGRLAGGAVDGVFFQPVVDLFNHGMFQGLFSPDAAGPFGMLGMVIGFMGGGAIGMGTTDGALLDQRLARLRAKGIPVTPGDVFHQRLAERGVKAPEGESIDTYVRDQLVRAKSRALRVLFKAKDDLAEKLLAYSVGTTLVPPAVLELGANPASQVNAIEITLAARLLTPTVVEVSGKLQLVTVDPALTEEIPFSETVEGEFKDADHAVRSHVVAVALARAWEHRIRGSRAFHEVSCAKPLASSPAAEKRDAS